MKNVTNMGELFANYRLAVKKEEKRDELFDERFFYHQDLIIKYMGYVEAHQNHMEILMNEKCSEKSVLLKDKMFDEEIRCHQNLITKYKGYIESNKKNMEELMDEEYSKKSVSWIEELVEPLSNELLKKLNESSYFNYRYDVNIPVGLPVQASIYFIPEHMKDIADSGVGVKKLFLIPNLSQNKIDYLTGKITPNPYRKGTKSYYIHESFDTAPLPDSIDDIFNILQSA
ncbi:hypothetical protein BFS06_14290 [Clostridium perfringens]|uniref:hypothetical protein n=1 Tax=Clostridium perfringens TaxID=1502 RepID=UPI00103DB937|nr:hypothetical protein [Clostridium perfringens]TBX14375.1 hypothetical protein BFS06_14290 [Clostridium perfringens]